MDGLVLLAFLAIAARWLTRLGTYQINDDEGSYLYAAWRIGLGEQPYCDFLTPQLPAFLYPGGLLMRALGPEAIAARALAVVAVLAAAVLLWAIARRLFGPVVAGIAMAAFLLQPDVFSAGRTFRSEPFMLLLQVAGTAAFARAVLPRASAVDLPSRRWLAFSGALFGTAALVKLFGPLPLAGMLLWLAHDGLERGRPLSKITADGFTALAPTAVVAAVGMGVFQASGCDIVTATITHHGMQNAGASVISSLEGGLAMFGLFARDASRAVPAAIALAVAAWSMRGADRRAALFGWHLPTALTLLALSRDRYPRHLVYLTPALAVLFAVGCRQVFSACTGRTIGASADGHPRRSGELSRLMAVALVAGSLGAWWLHDRDYIWARQEDGTQRLADLIALMTEPDELVLSDYSELNFYALRPTTFSAASLSSGAVRSRQITWPRLRGEIESADAPPALVVVETGSPYSHLAQLARDEQVAFRSWLDERYDLAGTAVRDVQTYDVFVRRAHDGPGARVRAALPLPAGSAGQAASGADGAAGSSGDPPPLSLLGLRLEAGPEGLSGLGAIAAGEGGGGRGEGEGGSVRVASGGSLSLVTAWAVGAIGPAGAPGDPGNPSDPGNPGDSGDSSSSITDPSAPGESASGPQGARPPLGSGGRLPRVAITARLVDADGAIRAQADAALLASGERTTDEWRLDELTASRVRLTVPPGTPPGAHRLLVGAYLTADTTPLTFLAPPGGQAQAWLDAGAVDVAAWRPRSPDAARRRLSHAAPGTDLIAHGQRLLGYVPLADDAIDAGSVLEIETSWLVEGSAAPGPALVRATLVDATDGAVAADRILDQGGGPAHPNPATGPAVGSAGAPGSAAEGVDDEAGAGPAPRADRPGAEHPEGAVILRRLRLPVLGSAPAGRYNLTLSAIAPDGTGSAVLGSIDIAAGDLTGIEFAPAHEPDVRLGAVFGDALELVGVDVPARAGALRAGTAIEATLTWRAIAPTGWPHHVTLQLLDTAGGATVQVDRPPTDSAGRSRPTTAWIPGEVLTDTYRLTTPADLPPGTYTLAAAVYRPDSGGRLPAFLPATGGSEGSGAGPGAPSRAAPGATAASGVAGRWQRVPGDLVPIAELEIE